VRILCFYRAQGREIRRRLGAPFYGGFHKLRFQVTDAIDRIQGQESDLVFISFCRPHSGQPSSQFGQWLQDLRRLNVACTRAHRGVVLVGNRRMLGP
jgi:superfamily I DNA and/or RNA helicase